MCTRTPAFLTHPLPHPCPRFLSQAVTVTNNTLALPRDLWLDPADGSLKQAFVPELAALRAGPAAVNLTGLVPPGGGANNATALAVRGTVLELKATFTIPAGVRRGVVGLALLSSGDGREYTAVALDLERRLVLLDRTRSGAAMDADVRAGPLPTRSGAAAEAEAEIAVHIYVDNSIVTLIAGNTTALTAWVHPQSPASQAVGLFSQGLAPSAGAEDGGCSAVDACGVRLSLKVWHLGAAAAP